MKRRFSKKHNLYKKTALILVAVMLLTTTVSGIWGLADSEEQGPPDVGEAQTQPTAEPPPEPSPEPSPESGGAEPEEQSKGAEPEAKSEDAETELTDPEDNKGLSPIQGGAGEIVINEVNTTQVQGGSISGFLWDDGDGTLNTDWNGFLDAGEQPVAEFTVYLYNASDIEWYIALPQKGKIEANMPRPIAATITNFDGSYVFNDLGPGQYAVGLTTGMAGDQEYQLPMVKTSQSVFKIHWTAVPVMAYSDYLTITGIQAITGINAGMRLPMGGTTAILNDIWDTSIYSSVLIDNATWWVLRRETINDDNYVLLLKEGFIGYALQFGKSTNDNKYNGSLLQSRITEYYEKTNFLPTIKSLAVVPELGDHSATNIDGQSRVKLDSNLKSTPAGNQTKDIMFALSYYDAWYLNGGTDSPVHSILKNIINHSTRKFFYLRTSSNLGGGCVWGVNNETNTLTGDFSPISSNVCDIVAIWVSTTVKKQVTVNYVDENGQPIGSPSSTIYELQFGDNFSINMGNVPAINGYDFTTQWRNGSDPTLLELPVSLKNVRNDADVYLVYKETQRYFVYDGAYPGSGTYVTSFNWLQEAVDRCEAGRLWTIVATENDDAMTGPDGLIDKPIVIPADKNITLTSAGQVPYTIKQPLLNTRHFRVHGTLTLKNIILDGAESGGGLLVARADGSVNAFGTLVIESGAAIQYCATINTSGGGGIAIFGGTVTMNGGVIKYNHAESNNAQCGGGGVHLNYGTFIMHAGEISGNSVTSGNLGFGGGVDLGAEGLTGGIFKMYGGTISGNTASHRGGGIFAHSIGGNNSFEMNGGYITENNAVSGGGIFISYSDFVLKNGVIYDNDADDGGGVYISNNSNVTMNGGTISGNKASRNGGGVYIANNARLTMNSGKLSGNESLMNGGGVYVSETSDTMKIGSVGSSVPAPEITGNKAVVDGGGIWTADYAKLQIASNAVFGKYGTASANIATTVPEYWPVQSDYTAAFQTRYTAPVGIYSLWGENYSTTANHPVNNCDINAISYTVTVNFVDDQAPEQNLDSDPPNQVYSKTYHVGDGASFELDGTGDRFIPEIDDYLFIDWGLNSPTALQGNTTVLVPRVTAPAHIYLIYMEIPKTTLTISNQVEGYYALRNKSWEFTVYILDENDVPLAMGTEFDFTITNGGLNPSPQTGTMMLGAGGSNTFYLKHDQQIEFDDVPLAAKVRIVETTAEHYDTSYIDSADPTSTRVFDHDTGGSGNQNPVMRQMSENRSFAFTNSMRDITDSGLDTSAMSFIGLSVFAGSAGLTYLVPAQITRRMRRGRTWDNMILSHQEYQAFMANDDQE